MRPVDWTRSDYEAARANVAELRFWAQASAYVATTLAAVTVACALLGAWQNRLRWRSWAWPSLVSFVPALLALWITLLGAAKGEALTFVLGVQVLALFAAGSDLRRRTPEAPSRLVSWGVLTMSLLGLLVRPLIPSR
jgi:hypothetical protein